VRDSGGFNRAEGEVRAEGGVRGEGSDEDHQVTEAGNQILVRSLIAALDNRT